MRRGGKGPPPGETPMIGSPAHPAGHKSSVPGWCTSRPHATMQSNALARERRPLGSSPGGARHSPPKAGGGKDPDFRGGSPLGRNPGIQRHPDGCVVHAFRCASRSGAGPHWENWPEIGPVLPVGVPCQRRHLDGWHSSGAAFSQQLAPVFGPASPADRATKPSRDGARARGEIENVAKARKSLLAYCKTDTLVMVKLHEVLVRMAT